MTNLELARRLTAFAHDQERDGANLFQIRAYRVAVGAISRLDIPVSDIFDEGGRAAIEALPGIGNSVAYTIQSILEDGCPRTLERPDRGREPDTLLTTLPGIGSRLAEQLRDRLDIHSLESLWVAGETGRLAQVGLSGKRLSTLMAAVRVRLEQRERPTPKTNEPSLEDLLAADEAYRHQQGSSWDRNGWRLKARYADTALAHRRGMTRDWVVVYYSRGEESGQRTIVTETSGDLAGMRVVRGREIESRRLTLAGHGHDSAA